MNAAVIALALPCAPLLGARIWGWSRRWIALVGIAAGVWIAVYGVAWRGSVTDDTLTLVAGTAVAVAWVVAGSDAGGSRPAAALTGAAAAGLVAAVSSAWTIPFVLFLLCSSTALLLGSRRWFSPLLATIVMIDLPVVAGLIAHAVLEDTWTLPFEPPPAVVLAAALSAVVRVGSVVAAPQPGPEAPVTAASGFLLLALLVPGGSTPAAVLILLAATAAGWSRRAAPGAAPLLLVLALAFLDPRAVAPAIAGVALAGALAVDRRGVARPGLILLLGPWPGTVLGAAVVDAAVRATGEATAGGTVSAGWHLTAAALLVAAVSGCVYAAAPSMRRVAAAGRLPVGAAELLALAVVVVPLAGATSTATAILFGVALAAGVAIVAAVPPGYLPQTPGPPALSVADGEARVRRSMPLLLWRAGAGSVAVAWLLALGGLYAGLRQGFL